MSRNPELEWFFLFVLSQITVKIWYSHWNSSYLVVAQGRIARTRKRELREEWQFSWWIVVIWKRTEMRLPVEAVFIRNCQLICKRFSDSACLVISLSTYVQYTYFGENVSIKIDWYICHHITITLFYLFSSTFISISIFSARQIFEILSHIQVRIAWFKAENLLFRLFYSSHS